MLSFKRGVRLPELKPANKSKISKADIPDTLSIPLQQHIGKPATPLVKEGDYVKKYQKIAQKQGKISANIHAPASGNVKEVNQNIVIEPGGEDKEERLSKLNTPGKDKIIERIAEAGIVGMGGATFPTDVKLQPPNEVEEFILNGCECEPYLTADHRLMNERAEEIVSGMKLMMKACGAKKGIIAIEENKKDVFEKLNKIASKEGVKTELVKTKYPQGAEKMLIYALTKKKVPTGKLPADVKCIVNNVATAKAVNDSVKEGIPLVERVVTITGEVQKQKNFLTPIGAPLQHLIDKAKSKNSVKKIIAGGPMMGQAIDDTQKPVVKGTSGVVLQKDILSQSSEECIRCGECLKVCPMNLVPTKIATFASRERFNEAEEIYAKDCIECGCCAYSCPALIDLVHYIKLAKEGINEINKK